MVCEKKKYFLFEIKASTGISFTPNNTSQSVKSEVTDIPRLVYSSSEKIRISELSTFTSAIGNWACKRTNSSGVKTTLRSGGDFLSLTIPNFMCSVF